MLMTCDELKANGVENVAMHALLRSDSSDDVKLKFMNYFYVQSHRQKLFISLNCAQYKLNKFYLSSLAAPYIKQCRSADPELVDCLKGALHHLRPWLKSGISEIQV